MIRSSSFFAILLAAGRSRRFGFDKLFKKIGGKTVFEHSLQFLENAPQISKIFIAASAGNFRTIEKIAASGEYKKVFGVIRGGRTRFESVQKCLAQTAGCSIIVIHNAANPFATQKELALCCKALRKKNIFGAGVGRPVASTLKLAPKGQVIETLPRRDVWEMETPQAVRTQEFTNAMMRLSKHSARNFTDDLSVLEAVGFATCIVPASAENRKITMPEDLKIAQAFADGAKDISAVGIGEDSHEFSDKWPVVSGKCLILGGVKISGVPAFHADSDGDVILHALCNALASSLGRGSLGTYATKMCRGGITDSRQYLKKNIQAMQRAHRKIQNVSFSLEAARPHIDTFAPKIKESLSALLKIPPSAIGITATSGEKLTPFGQGKAIKCQAIVLLQSDRIQK